MIVTHLKTYASIWSFRLKLIISHLTDFNKASHIDLELEERRILKLNIVKSYSLDIYLQRFESELVDDALVSSWKNMVKDH